MEDKECRIETKVFAPESELCGEKLCYVCKDGVWQEKGTPDFIVRP